MLTHQADSLSIGRGCSALADEGLRPEGSSRYQIRRRQVPRRWRQNRNHRRRAAETAHKIKAYRDSAAFKELLPLRNKLAKFRSFAVEGLPQ
jgi:hypothetical protein